MTTKRSTLEVDIHAEKYDRAITTTEDGSVETTTIFSFRSIQVSVIHTEDSTAVSCRRLG
jgi:hypothetical protein